MLSTVFPPKTGKATGHFSGRLNDSMTREQGSYRRRAWGKLTMLLTWRSSESLGQEKSSIISKYCLPSEFPMTLLPEHLGSMNMQRHMTLIIKLALVSQDKASMKEQMSAWGLVTIVKIRLVHVVNRKIKCTCLCKSYILGKWYIFWTFFYTGKIRKFV